MKMLNLNEAAEFLHIHPTTLQGKAKSGEIPGAKPGRAWVFIEEDLVAWVRSRYRAPPPSKEQVDRVIANMRPRTRVQDTSTADELERLLAVGKKRRR